FLKKATMNELLDLKNKKVIVIGGGNAAIDSARVAKRLGGDVTIVYRRTCDEMPCNSWELEESEIEGIHLHPLASPTKILGNGKVSGIECLNMELGAPDESGRACPMPVDGSNFVMNCDVVITAISQEVEAEPVKVEGITISPRKNIEADETTLA